MPDKKGRLTRQEGIFVDRFAATGDATYSADQAGYAFPTVVGSSKRADPAIMSAVRAKAREMLMTKGADVGVKVLIEVAEDVKQPAGARVQAADKLIRHSGLSAETSEAKEGHELSGVELAKAISELEDIRAAKAKDVTPSTVFD